MEHKIIALSTIDEKLLKTILLYNNKISSLELSEHLGLPQTVIMQKREFLEKHYLKSLYPENSKNLGYERIHMQIYSGGGNTIAISKKINGNEVSEGNRKTEKYDKRQPTDLIITDNLELFPLLDQVKAMSDIKGGICSEIVNVADERKSIPIGTLVATMKNKDHIAVSYSTIIKLEEMISSFFSSGLKQNMINLWIVKKQEAEQWKAILNKEGIDADAMIDSEELIIVTHEEIYSDAYFGSSFSPILEKLDSLKKIIQEKQKGGINAIDTVSGNLFLQKRFSDCINIEKNWQKIINSFEIPITLLCPYGATIGKGEKLLLIEYHNRGVIEASLDKLFEINIVV